MSEKNSGSNAFAGITTAILIVVLCWLHGALDVRCKNRGGELVLMTCIKADSVIPVNVKQPEKP